MVFHQAIVVAALDDLPGSVVGNAVDDGLADAVDVCRDALDALQAVTAVADLSA